nr:sugar ABC transporter ATP-binding protein [Mesorhizobium sp.]
MSASSDPLAEHAGQVREILSVAGLRKTFPGVIALGGVDFDVRRGEVHALLGANGAGKSTLIKVIAGLYRPDVGEIYIDGELVDFATTTDAMQSGVSVIYQDSALVPQLSIAENIFLGSEKRGALGLVDWAATHAAARQLCDRIGALFPTTTLVSELGPGQRQLVEIAKALRSEAKLLILDEPTASLSHSESERLFQLVRELAAAGVGIVYVSHRLDEIAPLVDRVTVLRDGLSAGTFPANALDRARIVSLITGQERHSVRIARSPSTKAAGALLEVRGLSRAGEYEDVSFVVRSGEVVVLTGLVGAGRTELLETIFGVRTADRGEIKIDGKPVSFRNAREAIAGGVALIPEDRRGQGISITMSIFENIALPILSRFVGSFGLRKRLQIAHAETMIRLINIRTPGPRVAAGALSGGNQQKVVLAKWLSTDSRVLLFDEPTQGVDVGAKDEIYGLIDQLAAEGRAILVVSSDLEEVLAIADRVLAMRAGIIVGEFIGQAISASRILDAITHGSER